MAALQINVDQDGRFFIFLCFHSLYFLLKFVQFSGGTIKNACFKAAAMAALRISAEDQKIKMADLVEAAEEESGATLPETLVFV